MFKHHKIVPLQKKYIMATKTWIIDPTHSEIHFKVKHLMITNVTGSFKTFSGSAITEENDFTNAKINFTAATSTVDTGNEQRDQHLQSDDFFSAATYPEISFIATKFENAATPGATTLVGDLTIKGITKSITFDIEFGGIANDFYGNTKAGFSISGKINRKDYGLTWGGVTDTGSIVLSDEVKISADVQLTEQK